MTAITEGRNTNFGRNYVKEWAWKHKPIMHNECKPIPKAKAASKTKPPPCYTLPSGICYCDNIGQERWGLYRKFYVMAKHVVKVAQIKQLMLGRYIILRINGHRPTITDLYEAELLEAQGEPTEEMNLETWWHCSTFSLKPWRISFRRCEFNHVDGLLVHLTVLL